MVVPQGTKRGDQCLRAAWCCHLWSGSCTGETSSIAVLREGAHRAQAKGAQLKLPEDSGSKRLLSHQILSSGLTGFSASVCIPFSLVHLDFGETASSILYLPGTPLVLLTLTLLSTPVQALPTTYFHRGGGEWHSLVAELCPECIAGRWPSLPVPPLLQHLVTLSAKEPVELGLAFSYLLLITLLKIARQVGGRGADRISTEDMKM